MKVIFSFIFHGFLTKYVCFFTFFKNWLLIAFRKELYRPKATDWILVYYAEITYRKHEKTPLKKQGL